LRSYFREKVADPVKDTAEGIRHVDHVASSIPVVPNLWYAYLCWYAADRLGLRENNIGNGGKHKKGVKIKTQKQTNEVSVYKQRLM
jgi:hypothetical protein